MHNTPKLKLTQKSLAEPPETGTLTHCLGFAAASRLGQDIICGTIVPSLVSMGRLPLRVHGRNTTGHQKGPVSA